jgi:hypothetical protein
VEQKDSSNRDIRKIYRDAHRKSFKHFGKALLNLIETAIYGSLVLPTAVKASTLDTVGNLSGVGVAAGLGSVAILSFEDTIKNYTLAREAIVQGTAEAQAAQYAEHLDNEEEL